MRVSQAKELFHQLVSSYFAGAKVTFTRQSRVAKPQIPLIALTPGNVKRPLAPVYKVIDGVLVGHYASQISIQVDLFTHGSPVIDEETGRIVAYENTAVDDMMFFADFLNSQHTTDWCHKHDVAILIDGDVQDLTGLVNDNNYEFRSRMTVVFYFTQKSIGYSAILSEGSIQYPTGETNPDTGEAIYTQEEPEENASTTGQFGGASEDTAGIIVPKFEETSSGGGTKELAEQDTGYFTEVEIKEEESNEFGRLHNV